MVDLVNDHTDEMEKHKKRKNAAIKWLKTFNLNNEQLISFSAELMTMAKEATENFESTYEKLIHQKNKPKATAKKGGEARSAIIQKLKNKTIELYESGQWKSAPIAAQSITPIIVELSKNHNGDLLPSTTKPLEWIREHRKMKKMAIPDGAENRGGNTVASPIRETLIN